MGLSSAFSTLSGSIKWMIFSTNISPVAVRLTLASNVIFSNLGENICLWDTLIYLPNDEYLLVFYNNSIEKKRHSNIYIYKLFK